jgi:hypothetical protein
MHLAARVPEPPRLPPSLYVATGRWRSSRRGQGVRAVLIPAAPAPHLGAPAYSCAPPHQRKFLQRVRIAHAPPASLPTFTVHDPLSLPGLLFPPLPSTNCWARMRGRRANARPGCFKDCLPVDALPATDAERAEIVLRVLLTSCAPTPSLPCARPPPSLRPQLPGLARARLCVGARCPGCCQRRLVCVCAPYFSPLRWGLGVFPGPFRGRLLPGKLSASPYSRVRARRCVCS